MPKHHYCYPRISRPSYGPVVVNIQRYIFLKIFFSMGVESFVSISGHNLVLISQSQNEIHKSLCSLYHTFSKQNSLYFNSETWIYLRGVARGGAEGARAPRNLADQLTLFKPGWADFAPRTTASLPPGFKKLSTPLPGGQIRPIAILLAHLDFQSIH